jgi:hypothetical protein
MSKTAAAMDASVGSSDIGAAPRAHAARLTNKTAACLRVRYCHQSGDFPEILSYVMETMIAELTRLNGNYFIAFFS